MSETSTDSVRTVTHDANSFQLTGPRMVAEAHDESAPLRMQPACMRWWYGREAARL